MNTAFEKIIEKLESQKERILPKENYLFGNIGLASVEGFNKGIKKAIEIVKQKANDYSNVIIDEKYCFQTCACTEKCHQCNRLCNGDIDWYENIDDWNEEFDFK